MTTTTEADLYRQSTALQFGTPLSNATTMATLVYVTLLTLGTVLVVAGTMSVSELAAGTVAPLAASAIVLGTGLALFRSKRGRF